MRALAFGEGTHEERGHGRIGSGFGTGPVALGVEPIGDDDDVGVGYRQDLVHVCCNIVGGGGTTQARRIKARHNGLSGPRRADARQVPMTQ